MELTKQKFRVGTDSIELYATEDGKCPLIDRNNRVRLFAPQMARRIIRIIQNVQRDRGNAKNPAKITPHRLELEGWREMTATEFQFWAEGAEIREDMHIASARKGVVRRKVYPDGIEVEARPVNRTVEQDAEKDRLRQLLAAKEAELEELRAMKAEQVNPPAPVEPEVVETPAPIAEDQEKPEPKKRGRKAVKSTEGGVEA